MYDFKGKEKNVSSLNSYMLTKTLSMFNYSGLPESMNSIELEKGLQSNGYTFITEHNGELYSLSGNFGGLLDVYGNPTEITITNPAINLNKTLSIKDDGVLIKNDDLLLGLLPMFERYNTMLVESEVTMFINLVNARIPMLLSAGDDATRESAEKFLVKIMGGEMGVIGENRLFEGIKSQTTMSNNSVDMTHLIEFNQYIKAGLFNEVGLNANFNMKRERLNTSEINMNTDSLFPLVDNMHVNRVQGIEKLNERYGLSVEVDFGSVWKRKRGEKDEHISESMEELDEPTENDVD